MKGKALINLVILNTLNVLITRNDLKACKFPILDIP